MKRFVFRLERLLQLRSRTERERAQELCRALHEEESRRSVLDEAAARLGRVGEQLAGTPEEVAAAGTLRNLGLTVEVAAGDMEAAAESHREALESVAAEQARYGEARRERRVVERLRENRKTVWDGDAVREEQKEHDGLARHRRSTGTGAP